MFGIFYIAVLLAGNTWKTEGALAFTHKPKSPLYVKEGTDAEISWNFSVTNRNTELQEIVWKVFSNADNRAYPMLVENSAGDISVSRFMPQEYLGRVSKTGRATLVIKNVTFNDTTTFTCRLQGVLGVAGTSQSDVDLVVVGQASVVPAVEFSAGDVSTTYTCNAVGVPSQNFTWWNVRGDRKIAPDAEYGISSSVSGSSVLTIKKPMANGYYRCDATVNTKQENVAKSYLQMLSSLKVDYTNCPKTLYRAAMGDHLTICCPVSGYPPPQVTWRKNGFLQKGENITWTVGDVKGEDFGTYTCTASNGLITLGPFNITLMNKVGNLSITTAADGTTDKPAKVEWKPEDTCGAKYLVEINGTEIRPDFMIGEQNSVEFHYFSLVMKDGNSKPDEVTICVEITAYCGKEVAGRSPPCDELTIKIKKPKDIKA